MEETNVERQFETCYEVYGYLDADPVKFKTLKEARKLFHEEKERYGIATIVRINTEKLEITHRSVIQAA